MTNIEPKVAKTVTTERKVHFELSKQDIIDLMVGCGIKVARDASVYMDVPGGGDWSNCQLDVDNSCPLVVRWTERTVEDDLA